MMPFRTPWLPTMRRKVRTIAGSTFPRSVEIRLRTRSELKDGEPELRILPHLASSTGTSVDVGANLGAYCRALAPVSERVIAFEANPVLARRLARLVPNNVLVVPIGLAARAGEALFHVPKDEQREWHWRGRVVSSEGEELPGTGIASKVQLLSLDSLALQGVHILKIDVEGLELEVLRGADETITKNRPCLLVETEYRHGADPSAVFSWFSDRGFQGFFLFRGQILAVEQFERAIHQNPSRSETATEYSQNFFFLPSSKDALRLRDLVDGNRAT
jgi:FkbM family methyltransferase